MADNPKAGSAPKRSAGDYQKLLHVPVVLRAELGRSELKFRDVEMLGPGAVVTLNRLAGEPVELHCRGRCIARGEVVIQDEAFAIRVTEIVREEQQFELMSVRRSSRRRNAQD